MLMECSRWRGHFRHARNSQIGSAMMTMKLVPYDLFHDASGFCTQQNMTKCYKMQVGGHNCLGLHGMVLNKYLGLQGIANIRSSSCNQTHPWQLSFMFLPHISLDPSTERQSLCWNYRSYVLARIGATAAWNLHVVVIWEWKWQSELFVLTCIYIVIIKISFPTQYEQNVV